MKKVISIGAALAIGAILAWVTRSSTTSRSAQPSKPQTSEAHGADGLRSTPSPPPTRLVISGTKPAVSTDPFSDDYNAVQRAQVLDEAPADIFDSEPRLDSWAPGFEVDLTDHLIGLTEGLFEELTITAECKTSSCAVTVRSPGQLEEVGDFLRTYAPVGEVVSRSWIGEDGERALVLTGLLSPDLLDFSKFEAWSAEHRRLREERIKRMSE